MSTTKSRKSLLGRTAKSKALGGAALVAFMALTGPAQAGTWLGFTMGRGRGGVRVKKVLKGSPAAVAGLRKGDLVTQVEKKAVKTPKAVIQAYRGKKVGGKVRLVYTRGGQSRRAILALTKRPPLAKLLKLLLTGERAKGFQARKVSGGTVSLASLRGKVVLIEFWSTWCGSCVVSLKKLKKVYFNLKKKGFRVVALARNSLADTKKKVAGLGLPFIIGSDPKARIAKSYHLAKVPSLVLIDRKGVIRDIWLGSSYNLNRVTRLVKKLLKEKP